jgi:hypothetical protein
MTEQPAEHLARIREGARPGRSAASSGGEGLTPQRGG